MRAATIIPVFNHSRTIVQVARQALALGFPVFVVNDGSTETLPPFPNDLQAVHTLQHRTNRGKGAALETGMRAAADFADWAITIDADGQHNPQDATTLLSAIPTGQRPIVVGRRRGMRTAPWTSRSGRKFSNFWVWVSGGPRLTDSQSGFRVYPIPETLDLTVHARRYQYEIEVLVKARRKGIPVIEAPVGVIYQADIPRISHFHPFLDFLRNTGTFSRLITRRVFTPQLWRQRREQK
ncbi:MAG: glycosyltransferase family 2 protein [Desulfobacterales bacterium]|nr:glycosyltransferase family 2 protein [Desulfobacterales bacterium]